MIPVVRESDLHVPDPGRSVSMKKFSVLTGILAISLVALTAVPASASAPAPRALRLANYTTTVSGPPATIPGPPSDPACNDGSLLYCGIIAINATFSGLGNRARPQTPAPSINLLGSVSVTRTYGCTNAAGRLQYRFNRVVRESAPLNTRRGFGTSIPTTGDTLAITTFAFLRDRQPFNCPPGMTAVNTSIVASGASLQLDSYFESVPDATYKAQRWAAWFGIRPTPPRVGA
jgi:hypothetical protein